MDVDTDSSLDSKAETASVAAAGDSSNVAGPPQQSAVPQHVRHASLKVRIDSANHDDAPGPAPPKTAEPRPQAVHSPSPRPPTGSVAPIVIKRTTSFSQRIHSLLHREKSQKHSPGTAGHETPTIAYRTPTSQTQSTNVSAAPSAAASADNSPPSGISPHASLVHVGSEAAAYRAQRSFEPVPEDNVFAVSYTNLRSVNRHSRQLQQAIQSTVASPADELVGMVDRASIASKRLSGHPVSREPSQTTLLRQPSAADADSAAAVAGTPPDAATAPVATRPSDDSGASSSMLAGKTLAIRPPRPLSLSIDTARNQEQLAAGPTREHHLPTPPTADVCPSPHIAAKKAVYSTHKASLNQFGRQTKVIGTGTGGTVRLLQGADLCVRPPSLRSGPASSHPGDDPCAAYVPSQHKLFAVKEFRKRRAEETPRAYMKKVTSEFCIGSSIHHENVIETLDLIFEGDRVYEIMEYCPHDLFTFVVNANMDLDETFCWFKQVCQGVQYLHRIGIAHRDLKLENCLLTDRGVVKIIDFGCATVYKTPFQKEPSQVVGVCGSDPYIAPEVLLSRRQIAYYAQIADIWSVGIMYMCMTLLKFPWRIADTETDRNYGSYIREWPRGREKLFAQLPKLRHGGMNVIGGMVYPDAKGRLTMDEVMDSEWMKEVDCCHPGFTATSHVHNMNIP